MMFLNIIIVVHLQIELSKITKTNERYFNQVLFVEASGFFFQKKVRRDFTGVVLHK